MKTKTINISHQVKSVVNQTKTLSNQQIRICVMITLFTLALLGSWVSDGLFLKELSIGATIFCLLMLHREYGTYEINNSETL